MFSKINVNTFNSCTFFVQDISVWSKIKKLSCALINNVPLYCRNPYGCLTETLLAGAIHGESGLSPWKWTFTIIPKATQEGIESVNNKCECFCILKLKREIGIRNKFSKSFHPAMGTEPLLTETIWKWSIKCTSCMSSIMQYFSTVNQ